MNKKSLKILLFSVVFVFLFLFVYNVVFAVQLNNPLGNANNDPRAIIGNVIKAILGITGSLALAVFILGGLTWVTSAGNEERIKKGKDMIMWAAFGIVVVFAAYALVTFVLSALTGGTDATTNGIPSPETSGR